jgi:DNA primase
MLFPNDFIEKVKNANNIVDVASSYLPVKQKGRQYWACCPFHHEKTPSFAIYEDTQSFHCFGCKESGNVFKFVRQMENCDFGHAVELLAKRAGLKLPDVSADPKQIEDTRKKQKTLEIIEHARDFYFAHLGREATEYLHKRGVTDELIKTFNIGQSPDWVGIITHLKTKGFTENELLAAGIIAKNDKGHIYDAMGERIVFSINDLYGNCIGFTGRIMPAKDNGEVAKYRNTAQTAVFDKGHIVYGGDVLKKYMRQNHINEVIVVEGNVDVITLVGAGFNNTVACMGTALTPFHVRELGRMAGDIYLCFDGDAAGRKATLRAIEIFQNEKSAKGEIPVKIPDVRIITMPAGIDPDGFVRQNGKRAFQELFDAAKPMIDYKLDELAASIKMDDNIGKARYLNVATEILKGIKPLEVELYAPKVAQKAGVAVDAILRAVGLKTGKRAVITNTIPTEKGTNAFQKASELVAASKIHNQPWAKDNLDFEFDYDPESPILQNYEFHGTFAELDKYYIDCVGVLYKEYKRKLRDEFVKQFTDTEDMEIIKMIGNINKEIKNGR